MVESPFAAVRQRTSTAKRFHRVEVATALIWKLLMVAEMRFRKRNAPHLLPGAIRGDRFEDGQPVPEEEERRAALRMFHNPDPEDFRGTFATGHGAVRRMNGPIPLPAAPCTGHVAQQPRNAASVKTAQPG